MENVNQNKLQISLRNDSFGTESCSWEVPLQLTALYIDEYALGAWDRPETLFDDEYCMYGGIFVYSKRNTTEPQEIISLCRRDYRLEFNRLIPEEGGDTMIAVVVFYSYSKNVDHTFILR